MNATKSRQVKAKAKEMFIEWLGTHLSEEEKEIKYQLMILISCFRTNSYLC